MNFTEIIVFYNILFVTHDFGIDYKNNEANLMHIQWYCGEQMTPVIPWDYNKPHLWVIEYKTGENDAPFSGNKVVDLNLKIRTTFSLDWLIGKRKPHIFSIWRYKLHGPYKRLLRGKNDMKAVYHLIFTRGQLWPLGIVIACVCLCVCLSMCVVTVSLSAW